MAGISFLKVLIISSLYALNIENRNTPHTHTPEITFSQDLHDNVTCFKLARNLKSIIWFGNNNLRMQNMIRPTNKF